MKNLWQLISRWGIYLNVTILIFCLIPLLACNAADQSPTRPRVGGSCEYKKYRGEAVIVSVAKRTDASQEYEIKFSFNPQETIDEEFARPEGKTWTLVLKDSSYPKNDFLTQFDIKTGKRIPCYLRAITRGTCTPVLFEFPTIPQGWAQ